MRRLPSTLLTAPLAHREPSSGLADDVLSALRQAITVNVPENAMSVPIEVLAQRVLQLPVSNRMRLLDRVISSLNTDRDRDALWNRLAADRDAQADMNPAVLAPGSQTLARVRAHFN